MSVCVMVSAIAKPVIEVEHLAISGVSSSAVLYASHSSVAPPPRTARALLRASGLSGSALGRASTCHVRARARERGPLWSVGRPVGRAVGRSAAARRGVAWEASHAPCHEDLHVRYVRPA